MAKNAPHDLISLLTSCTIGGAIFHGSTKFEFRRIGKAYMRQLAALLSLKPGKDCDIRFNEGGIAVSGDLILHTDYAYVQISQPQKPLQEFMIRSCVSRRDFRGGANIWLPLTALNDLPALAAKITAFKPAGSPSAPPAR